MEPCPPLFLPVPGLRSDLGGFRFRVSRGLAPRGRRHRLNDWDVVARMAPSLKGQVLHKDSKHHVNPQFVEVVEWPYEPGKGNERSPGQHEGDRGEEEVSYPA